MPKVKLINTPNYTCLTKNIKKAMVDREIDDLMEFSKRIGWNYQAAYFRIRRKPESMKISDLADISRTLKVPMEELVQGILQ